MTVPDRWRVNVDGEVTTAILEKATTPSRAVFVCAHGAGGHMADQGMESVVGALRVRGLDVVRFNFLYRERGSGRPDPMPKLKACMQAVIERTRQELSPQSLIIGGRSMGGRAGSMLAADGLACDGLLLLAYPLHPAGQPDKLRDAHLPRIGTPVLCLNGTRDALCRKDLMERIAGRLAPRWQMHWLEGADHSFHVLKSSGRTDEDVLNEVCNAVARWLGDSGVDALSL